MLCSEFVLDRKDVGKANIHKLGLVQETKMGDVDTRRLIELDVLDQEIGVCLPPVAASTRLACNATKVPAIGVFSIRFHESRGAPCVGVDGFDAIRYSFGREPHLTSSIQLN